MYLEVRSTFEAIDVINVTLLILNRITWIFTNEIILDFIIFLTPS